MRGRKPKPTYLKLVEGNRGRRPMNPDEPKPELAIPTPPEGLSEEAQREWDRLAVELHSLGLLTRIDRAALVGYVTAWSDFLEAEAQLKKYGKVIKSPVRTVTRRARNGTQTTERTGGYPIPSPFLSIRNKALTFMLKFSIEFGLTPSSRSRVHVPPLPPSAAKDPAAKYLA